LGWRGSENIDREKYTYAAQLGVLQACPPALSRLLHRDDGPVGLVAAKIYVLSKLLLKSLSEKVCEYSHNLFNRGDYVDGGNCRPLSLWLTRCGCS
jgi:hypothetical protein